ncbi:hypothetical protein [Sphingorhabdus sp.]|uniref:hypothetical protein n=1 Tax=Sphingorhabdus sp. TaxID=1902408 RepID=UPI00391A796C
MDTPDLQGFADGNGVHIEPIRIAAMFNYPIEGRMLSDHDALSVTYRISWRATRRTDVLLPDQKRPSN